MKLFSITLVLISGFILRICPYKAEKMANNIDHIILAAPSLEEGINYVNGLLGVEAVIGGRHPLYGTHNALLSLGDSIYLEIVAPDPNSTLADNKVWLKDKFEKGPHIATWVMRADKIQDIHRKCLSNGIALGDLSQGERIKPDGTVLSWTLSNPNAMPYGGALPFLINWGETANPAQSTPAAGRLKKIVLVHPQSDKLKDLLKVLNCSIEIEHGDEYKLRAYIESNNGRIVLE